jgi:hypothetical protein
MVWTLGVTLNLRSYSNLMDKRKCCNSGNQSLDEL